MENSNKKSRTPLTYIFLGMLFISLSLLACGICLKVLFDKQVSNTSRHYKSYKIANELRRTSDDLTTMVRLYVATGEKVYLNQFNEILDIRSGKTLRPEEYDNVYWDLVLDKKRPSAFGPRKSLYSMMLEQYFDNEEFELLEQAETRSNELAVLENKAMQLLLEKEGSDNQKNKELAVQLVFGSKYMEEKAKIMEPIRVFIKKVETRTLKENQELIQKMIILLYLIIVLSMLLLLSIYFAFSRLSRLKIENSQK